MVTLSGQVVPRQDYILTALHVIIEMSVSLYRLLKHRMVSRLTHLWPMPSRCRLSRADSTPSRMLLSSDSEISRPREYCSCTLSVRVRGMNSYCSRRSMTPRYSETAKEQRLTSTSKGNTQMD